MPEELIQSRFCHWMKSGTDVSAGTLGLTGETLFFAGETPKAFGNGLAINKLTDALLEYTHRNQEKSFSIPLEEIRSVEKPDSFMKRGAMNVVTAERTYMLAERKKWLDPIREAIEAKGIETQPTPDGNGFTTAS